MDRRKAKLEDQIRFARDMATFILRQLDMVADKRTAPEDAFACLSDAIDEIEELNRLAFDIGNNSDERIDWDAETLKL